MDDSDVLPEEIEKADEPEPGAGTVSPNLYYDVDPDEEVITVTYEITSYGADYPVDGLVKRLDRGDITIPSFDPAYKDGDEIRGFQRSFVWTRPQMDRFIESLLLGLPVPGIFLVRSSNNRLLVLDGQQRLRTLQAFYSGAYRDRVYKLIHVQRQFQDKSYETLDDEDRRRVDDSIIHATVLRQESPAGSQDAVYSIFERLNTGGSALQPQEIRVALYSGPFLASISRLNEHSSWRKLYGPRSNRFKDQELILRVFALFEEASNYTRPLKGFLNHYLFENQNRDIHDAGDNLADVFESACETIETEIGPSAFRPIRALNAATLDAVMVGVMRRVQLGDIHDPEEFKKRYRALMSDKRFTAATTSSTAGEDAVGTRVQLAIKAFADLT